MDSKAALATAAGLVLVVAGAASALTSAWTSPSQAAPPPTTTANVVTEYVDEFGNPVAAPAAAVQADTVIMTRSPAPADLIVYEQAAPISVEDAGAPAVVFDDAVSGDEFEGEDADEDEFEGEDADEDEDESHDD